MNPLKVSVRADRLTANVLSVIVVSPVLISKEVGIPPWWKNATPSWRPGGETYNLPFPGVPQHPPTFCFLNPCLSVSIGSPITVLTCGMQAVPLASLVSIPSSWPLYKANLTEEGCWELGKHAGVPPQQWGGLRGAYNPCRILSSLLITFSNGKLAW